MNLESSTAERVKSGVILALFAATVLLVGGALLIAVCILLTGVLSFEFLRVTLPPYRRGEKGDLLSDDALIYSVALSLIPAGLVFGGLSAAVSIAVLLVMATLLREMRRYEDGVHEEHSLDSVSALALTLIYPVLLATIFLGAVLQIPAEPYRVLIWYVVVVAFNDIGAWAVGSAIGKRKLAP